MLEYFFHTVFASYNVCELFWQNLFIEAVAYRRDFAEKNMASIELEAKVLLYWLLFVGIGMLNYIIAVGGVKLLDMVSNQFEHLLSSAT